MCVGCHIDWQFCTLHTEAFLKGGSVEEKAFFLQCVLRAYSFALLKAVVAAAAALGNSVY